MDILTIDFETYYDKDYSLKKMTMIEYIMDGRFQPIMMSYALNDDPVSTVVGYPAIRDILEKIDWSSTVLNAQNCAFDATILNVRFGKTSAYYTDTMAMARVTGAHIIAGGASLEKIGELLISLGYPIPPKGTAVKAATGLHLYNVYDPKNAYLAKSPITDENSKEMDDAKQLLRTYIEYCENDVELARQAFKYFVSLITPAEMQFGDMILKCYIQPQFFLDLKTIQDEIERINQRDLEFIQSMADTYFEGNIPELRKTCRSAPKFTAFLESLGGIVPPANGAPYRFLIPARLSEKKGRIEPCYSKSFGDMMDVLDHEDPDIADVFKLKLLMTSSIELSRAQRFESIAKLGAGFGMPYSVSGAHTHRLGGCLVGDTKIVVMSPDISAYPRIINLKTLRDVDLVWDGEQFCKHDGLIYKGKQQVSFYNGVRATDDHVVFTTEMEQVTFKHAKEKGLTIKEGEFPSNLYPKHYASSSPDLYDLIEVYNKAIDELKLGCHETDHSKSALEDVYDIKNCGENHRFLANGRLVHNSGGLNVQNLSSGRKAGQSNALKRSIIAPEGYVTITYDSSQIELRTGAFIACDYNTLNMFVRKEDPYSHQASLIYGGDPAEIKRLAKSGVEPYASTQRPVGKSNLLSCIYGTGSGGFQNYLKINGIAMPIDECERLVRIYRQTHPEVVSIWRQCDNALNAMIAGGNGYFGGPDGRLFYYDGSRKVHGTIVPGIRLPDGNWLNYYKLQYRQREMPDGTTKQNLAYYGIKDRKAKWVYTYASKVFENINQAIAFAIMKYQAMLINRRYRIAGNTHDEWFITVPEAEAEAAAEYMQWCMKQAPDWAKEIPLDCEGSAARRYGDCK